MRSPRPAPKTGFRPLAGSKTARAFLVSALVTALLPAFGLTAVASGTVTFEGGGYGHGVGMPQYGAQGMAVDDGATGEEIVEYYYTGASMVSLEDAVGAGTSPLLEYNNALWLGVAPDQTLLEFEAIDGPLEICQPSVACPLAAQPQPGEVWKLKLKPNGKCVFKFDGQRMADPGECWGSITRLEGARIDFPSIGKTVGHGKMRFRPKGDVLDPDAFHVSFNMDMEEYLLGIAESFNWWEPAALQAQAIASRSFAAAKAHQRETGPRDGPNPGFTENWKSICWCHVRATTADQAYAGWSQSQSATWSAAVQATDQMVLTHPDSAFTEIGVVSAFFSSSSGGVTETNIGGFGSSVQYPYLISVPDPWSVGEGAANPFASWEKEVASGDVISALATAGQPWEIDFDVLTNVEHLSGPPESIVRFTGLVDGQEQSVDVPGWWLRPAFGLRSPQVSGVQFEQVTSQIWHQDVGEIPSPIEDGDRFASGFVTGDFDNDGHLDIAVSAYTDGINSIPEGGLVNIIYGTIGGLTAVDSQMIHEDMAGVPGTAQTDDHLGRALASGDFDNDGYDDLAIGIPHQDDGTKVDVGSVLIVMGSSDGLDMTDSHRVGPGDSSSYGARQNNLEYGWALSSGDFDDDGLDDLVVGAPGRRVDGEEGAGKIQVLTNWNGADFDGVKGINQNSSDVPGKAAAGDQFGYSLTVNDFNNDGYADVVAGAPGDGQNGLDNAGLVIALYGSSGGVETPGAIKVSQSSTGVPGSPSENARFGEVLASGKLDSGGRADLVVGAPGDVVSGIAGGSATVLLSSGSGFDTESSVRLRQGASGIPGSPQNGDQFGAALAIGDIHGDGFNDLLIGVPGESVNDVTNAGAIRLVRGTAGGLDSHQGGSHNQSKPGFNGTLEQGDRFGSAVGLWDLSGDGAADWVVGSADEDTGGFTDAGLFHLVFDL